LWPSPSFIPTFVKTIDEMLRLDLLSAQQHRDIALWPRANRTPEAFMRMPPLPWRAIESASWVMNTDADLIRSPLVGAASA
jgi:hypothetical protein